MFKNKLLNDKSGNILTIYKNRSLFYNVYDIDAYIISYIFGYKVLNNRKCGFPESVFSKVIETLENNKISYQVIYSDKSPIMKDFKKINKYEYYYRHALNLIDRKNRLDIIIDKLNNASSEDIDNIIKVLENVSNK